MNYRIAQLDGSGDREKNATIPLAANEENMKKLCLSNPVLQNGSETNYQFQPAQQQNVTYFIPPAGE